MTSQLLSETELMSAYRKMYLLRVAEEKIADFYLKNKIMSFIHFYIGQEAVACGVADCLTLEDKMLGNHRSHGHYLAKGGDLKRMVSELLGKEAGSSHGKGGSMHMIDKTVNFVGSTPILGSVVPLAAGVAFEQKFNHRPHITTAFIGDGAFEEGAVTETINLAGLFKLPLLLVVENNLFAVNSTLTDRRAAGHDSQTIVRGLGARYERADGNDYFDVRAKAATLVASVRAGEGPAVLECITFRHMAHSAPIFDESCRKDDVLETRTREDALAKLRNHMLGRGVTEGRVSALEQDVVAEVEASIDFAKQAPYPHKDSLYTHVYE